jgi:hypothetical protein
MHDINRETKLVKRAARHFQKTAQRFEDEDGFISSCFHNIESDVVTHERISARMHLIRNTTAILSISKLQDIAHEEAKQRENEDIIVLDTVFETQNLLQQMVSVWPIQILSSIG